MKKILICILFLGTVFAILAPRKVNAYVDPVPPTIGRSRTIECDLGGRGINTAIGCIPINSTDRLVAFFLRWAAGIGGGITLLLIIYSSFIIITSSGDPKRVQAGKETLTAAILGLILILSSVFILKIAGIDILGLSQITG